MKYKAELIFTIVFALFMLIMNMTNPREFTIHIIILLVFFMYIPAICIINILKYAAKTPKSKLSESFKNHHIIIQILCILMIITAIYDIITQSNVFYIIFSIFWIAIMIEWFFKKEK